MSQGVSAIEYHERTKHTPRSVRGASLDFENKPRPDTIYRGLPRFGANREIPGPSMPALQAIASADWNGTGNLGLETLLALCYYAAGITKTISRHGHEHEFRAAACTGALYHIDLYAVCGDIEDLEAGVYHYDPRTDTLERLRNGDYRGNLATATCAQSVQSAPVTMIATSTWWRNAWKYEARTYRHAFWDSGTILANLLAAARGFDLPAEVVTGFADDDVTALLGLDPEWCAPLELVAIGTGTPIGGNELSVEPIDPEKAPLDSNPIEYPLIYDAWRSSTLADGDAVSAWRDRGPRPVDGRGSGADTGVQLEPEAPESATARPLDETIHRRGSCREYVREPIPFRTFSTVLDRAVRGLPLDVRAETSRPFEFLDCYCIANGIDGLEDGFYQYHAAAGTLEHLRSGTAREEAGQLALGQRLGADAAACLY
ncbi:MAG: SagB family peptide dehydrogenase, partial [Salinirussus sp.]